MDIIDGKHICVQRIGKRYNIYQNLVGDSVSKNNIDEWSMVDLEVVNKKVYIDN